MTTAVRLVLRPATCADSALLWRWRNDPATRAASLNTTEVGEREHVQWIEDTLARPDRRLYVGIVGERPVATARLDIENDAATVSVTVAPEQRGSGLGTALVRAVSDEAFATTPVQRLVAVVKRDNVASRRAFARAGFELVEDAGATLTMVRPRSIGERGGA